MAEDFQEIFPRGLFLFGWPTIILFAPWVSRPFFQGRQQQAQNNSKGMSMCIGTHNLNLVAQAHADDYDPGEVCETRPRISFAPT